MMAPPPGEPTGGADQAGEAAVAENELPFPTAGVRSVLDAAFLAIIERHLKRATPEELLLWSLRGLVALDPQLSAELRERQVRLTGTDRIVSTYTLALPPLDAAPAAQAAAVAEVLTALLEDGWTASPSIRRAGLERVLQSAFEELFNHLDPYSRYVTPAEARAAQERRVGQSGLGLRLAAGRGNTVTITAVEPGGPAALAGLRTGDRLLAVDGARVSSANLSEAASRLEGPLDSIVVLEILRRGGRAEVVLVRAPVPPRTVAAERRDGLLWLRLTGFSNATDTQLAQALRAAFAQDPPRGIVLDLRGNRGGLLTQAVAVADIFLDRGEVVRTVGRNPESNRIYMARGPDLARGRPLVVLVDGRTASSAEIVAAALTGRRRAVAVGSATMGKGLVQLLMPLPNGAELLLTWSRLVAPGGWLIQSLGVLPGLCTSLGEAATTAALATLGRGHPPLPTVMARERGTGAPLGTADVARLRGTCPPAEGRDADLEAARLLLQHPEAWRTAVGR